MYDVRSPGRVNLIGEHTDYTGGYVLPMATDLHTRLEAQLADDVTVYSETIDDRASFSPDAFERDDEWIDYVKGVYHVLQDEGYDPGGFEGEITATLPLGSGLSSSASLELAVLALLNEAYDLGLTREEMALLGQRVENDYVGVSCGIMDQFAVSLARDGHALLVDTETLEYDLVPVPDDLQIIVFHTGVERELTDSAYNQRRETVEGALDRIGATTTKSLADEDLADLPDLERRRLGYISRENERVHEATDALADGDLSSFGDTLVEAHRDIAEDYEASCDELDFFVDTAVAKGAYGARLTGAGWGGAGIAAVDPDDARSVAERTYDAYTDRFPELDPTHYLVEPSAGVEVTRE
ncbi:MAG: galactokinase [Haloarculaceae archaeon]